ANDPHTEGIHNAARIANMAGIDTILISPSESLDEFCETIKLVQPKNIGLSYRLTPEIAVEEFEKALNYFVSSGLLKGTDDVRISIAGLPETITMMKARLRSLPLPVILCEPYPDVMDRAIETLNFFEVKDSEVLISRLQDELRPKGITILDELADEVVAHDQYVNEAPLSIPSTNAINNYTERIKESSIPLLRSHFGIPSDSIQPTVEGIKLLAEARVLDEISLGSSDLSQRYFGYPEMFVNRKNDGGVPYKTIDDLGKLYQASRRGNYPGVKPYCHVNDIVNFVDQCLSIGLLKGAHQAVPLFWFNELDGRGDKTVRESIKEHFAAVSRLSKFGIPVEMNDPNQWSSRQAHDTLIVTSYALIAAVMTMCGVKDMVFQMQFNKPKETGDYADLAKMSAGMEIAQTIASYSKLPFNIIRETRAGIEHFSSDMNLSKWQLARTTMLQMLLKPQVIHIVSYCEANYAARPEDIIDSSKLIRHAVRIFNENKTDIIKSIDQDIVMNRQHFLLSESKFLLNEISKFNKNYTPTSLDRIAPLIGLPDVIADAIENKIMASPGIINPKYRANYLTKPMKYGMINAVEDYSEPVIMTEKERLNKR
ncbi:MAG: hypothetical protein K2K97_04690, partial [Muribaculaceae bacterium]|nr:hypothetical protein [Muribaculaceae bacterium]